MLPETLSNCICSLNPKVDRLGFACDMQIDRDGQVTDSRFYEAVMRSHARLTYTQVAQALDGDSADAGAAVGTLMPQLRHLHQMYKALSHARQKRGAIEFETSEVRFVLGASGEVVQASSEEHTSELRH